MKPFSSKKFLTVCSVNLAIFVFLEPGPGLNPLDNSSDKEKFGVIKKALPSSVPAISNLISLILISLVAAVIAEQSCVKIYGFLQLACHP